MQIPIENIYYLLCYAWNTLPEKDYLQVETEAFSGPLDLLARALVNGSRLLLKKGIDHNYKETPGEVAGVKGKLLLSQTLKRNLLPHQKTFCIYDEFSADILSNRIWITTLRQLIRIQGLNKHIKEEVIQIIRMLPPVTPIRISSAHFNQIRLNRNNKLYGFILNVCRLIFENTLPTEKEGVFRFTDFTKDERKMALIFESFVRNFYQLEQTTYTVSRERLKWHFSYADATHQQYLPNMITDISLENKEKKIIIDTKYYTHTLTTHYEVEKIHSTNLYQLFSYLMNPCDNTPKARQATGILLYPTINKEYNLTYQYNDHTIHIKTINLNTHWSKIEKRLREIIETEA